MRAIFKRPLGWNSLAYDEARRVEKYVGIKVANALQQMHYAILDTPVYTGRTLVNFHWSVGAPVTDVRSPVKEPGLPGKTSDKAIGREPRRSAQERVINAEFRKVQESALKDPFQHFYLTNTVPNFSDIEYGTYRAGARTPPGGITRRGEVLVRIALGVNGV